MNRNESTRGRNVRWICLLGVMALAGCTDAARSNIGRLGDKHEVVCFSGGKEVLRVQSTGKPLVSDGGVITWTDGNAGFGASADCIYKSLQ